MKGDTAISLLLPPLPENDPMLERKKNLFHARNISTEFQLPLSGCSLAKALQILDDMILAARILNMDETEVYFAAVEAVGPFSPRNELESLNSILSVITSALPCDTNDGMELLQFLRDKIVDLIKSFGEENIDERMIQKCNSGPEELLLQWGRDHGVRTKLEIAYFEGEGRGAVAAENMDTGDVALEIPESLIICEDVVRGSNMFNVLKDMDGITKETMLLLWSMKERYNANSKFRRYFEALPKSFNTGLSFGIDALSILEGTLLFEEILQAREHLREQYEALCPVLCASHPDIFPPKLYTWEQFLWACELWYSNGMRVVFIDGKLKTCLVPVGGLLNHSLQPHILRYGRVNAETNSLRFLVSRPCKEGEQCYLSYGSLSGSHLVTFYGFLPKGDNPYDVIPLDIDNIKAEDDEDQLAKNETHWTNHMVRGTWLSSDNKLYTYGLPSPLLWFLRVALRETNSSSSSKIPICSDITKENEQAVLETIISIFGPMMEGLGELDNFDREDSSWDVKLALEFKRLQRRIISSVLDSCSAGLQMLESL